MKAQQTKIIDRIKKLMSLAGNNPNPEEAAAAAAKAHELLMEHKLEHVDFDTQEKPEAYDNDKYDVGGNRASVTWRRHLMHILAKHNFCASVWQANSTHVHLVGKRTDQEIVKYLFEYVAGEIPRMFKRYCTEEGFIRKPDIHSYAQGVINTLHKRFTESRDKAQQAAATGQACTALVVREGRELDIAKRQFFPYLRKTSSGRKINDSAYLAGQRDGRNISLTKGVGHKPAGYLS